MHFAGKHEAAAELAEAVLGGEAQAVVLRQSLAGMAGACALKQIGLTPANGETDFQGTYKKFLTSNGT